MVSIAKALVLVSLFIAAGFAGAGATNSSTRLGTRYSMQFPSIPSCGVMQIDAPWGKTQKESCTYYDERAGHGYDADYIDIAESIAEAAAEQVLLGAAYGAAANSDSEIANQRFIKVATFPALDATFYPKKKGYVAFVRYVLVDNDLVTMTADGYKVRDTPKDVTRFFDSLRVAR